MAPKDESVTDKTLASLLEKFGEIQMAVLAAVQKSSLSGDQLTEILSKVGETSALGMQKALRPENEMSPMVSAYNPEGDRDHPKPKLKRLVFFNDHREHSSDDGTADMLTRAEIAAYNELGDAAELHNGLLEARNGQYTAEIKNRGRELHLTVKGLAKLDTQSNLPPSLLLLCHEVKTGESMQDVNKLLEEVMRLRAELSQLQGPSARTVTKASAPPTISGPGGPLVSDLQAALENTPTAVLAGGSR